LETEQAHSPRIETYDQEAVRLFPRTAPLLWLNLVCLDAPLVAVAWLWLFGRTFHIPLQVGNCVALFLTAWLIYLADRLADSFSLKAGSPRSLRQEFCLRHRDVWITMVLLVAGFDAYVIWRSTALQTFLVGAVVGIIALIYLVLNHPLGLIWRSLPAKEMAIGFLFSAGTLVALLPAVPAVTMPFAASALAFAALCSLNCISLAGWECELDRAQRKVSIATRHPSVCRNAGRICAVLALLSFSMASAFRPASPILACVTASALLLTLLNAGLPQIDDDQRTALADLVLLTPIVALIVMAS
jgi:hypothetical protein